MTVSIKILTYLLILLFPLGQLVRFRPFTNVNIVPQDIVVFLIFLLTVFYYLKSKEKNEFFKFFLFQAAFLVVGVISLLINAVIFSDINLGVALLYSARYISYLSLLAIGPIIKDSKNIGKTFIASGAVFLLIGFIQYVEFNNLKPLFSLGWDEHLYRLFSSLLDPNYSGVVYAIYFFLLIGIVVRKRFNESYIHLVLSFFSIIAVYLTYSRTALVALVSGIAFFTVIKKKLKLFFMAGIVFIILLVTVSDIRVEGLNPFRTHSTAERVRSMKDAVEIITKSPLFGTGFNAYRYAQIRYGFRSEAGTLRSNADAGTDNSILFVLATTGVVGLAFYMTSYFHLFRVLVGNLEKNVPYITILVALFFASMFLNVLFYTPILTFVFLALSLRRKFD